MPLLWGTDGRHIRPALLIAVPGGGRGCRGQGWAGTRSVVGGVACVVLLSGLWSAAGDLGHVPQAVEPSSIAAPGAIDQQQLNAATYIGRHAPPDAIVMTNRHCTTPHPVHGRCDSRWFFVAAYSGRQMLVEGWGYFAADHREVHARAHLDHRAVLRSSPAATERRILSRSHPICSDPAVAQGSSMDV